MPDLDHLELTASQVVALYVALRLRLNGLTDVSPVDPVAALNRLTGRRWQAKTWAQLLEPYYQSITQPSQQRP